MPAGHGDVDGFSGNGFDSVNESEEGEEQAADGHFQAKGGMRRQVVTCNVNKNMDVESFVGEAERRVEQLALPPGVSYTFKIQHTDVTARVNSDNVTDKAAWVGIGSNLLSRNLPRMIKFTLTTAF